MTREQIKEAADKSWGFDNPCTQPVNNIASCCPRCGDTFVQTGYGNDCHCPCGCMWTQCDVGFLRLQIRNLLSLIDELSDREECRYDHHGYCQEHNLQEKPCPHERAKAIIAEAKGANP